MTYTVARDLLSTHVVVVRAEQSITDVASAVHDARAHYCVVVAEKEGTFEGLVPLLDIASVPHADTKHFTELVNRSPWPRLSDDTPADVIIRELSVNNDTVFIVNDPTDRYRGIVTFESVWQWLVSSRETRQRWLKVVFEEQRRLADFLERKIDQRTARLRRTLDDFRSASARLSHDIGGPLRSIKLFVERVAGPECGDLNPQGRSYVERILSATTKIEALTAEILGRARDTGRTHADSLHTIDLNEVLGDAIELATALIHERDAVISKRKDLHKVEGRYVPILQIISNLLINAITYVPASRRPSVEIWSEAVDDRVELYVKDNGRGINSEHLKAVFHPFFRVEANPHSGAGLGLSIARDAALELGGNITLESQERVGSLFTVTFQRASVLSFDRSRPVPIKFQ